MLEVILPASFPVTLGAVAAFLTLFASIIGVYHRLSGNMRHIEAKVDAMAERNRLADLETEAVKTEQAQQRTTVAVMAEQINGVTRTLERIDKNVQQILTGREK